MLQAQPMVTDITDSTVLRTPDDTHKSQLSTKVSLCNLRQ